MMIQDAAFLVLVAVVVVVAAAVLLGNPEIGFAQGTFFLYITEISQLNLYKPCKFCIGGIMARVCIFSVIFMCMVHEMYMGFFIT